MSEDKTQTQLLPVSLSKRIANKLAINEKQAQAAISLLDEGATVPFIARYRKEVTQGLDDNQLRALEEDLRYMRELDERRISILNSIKEQNKLNPDLEQQILLADTKVRLEDLYLPYKQKRRSKAQIAKEAGLEALALKLLENAALNPELEAQDFLNPDKGFIDIKQVLEGAKQILMEHFSEDAELLQKLRSLLQQEGLLSSQVKEGQEKTGEKYRDYFSFSEALNKIPSHRALALFRARNEGILNLDIILKNHNENDIHPCEYIIARHFSIPLVNINNPWLLECVRWAWRIKILTQLSLELLSDLKTKAESEAIDVFSKNLKDLLLSAPAGSKATMGLDPGLRTGVKVALVDETGKFVNHATIYPHAPKNQWQQSIDTLARLCQQHNISLISIGNGTASRETDKLVLDLIKQYPQLGLKSLIVSEAGASVYSASEFAAKEFPELDVTIRGAVSIARRLQDPLAELVKIEPKSIGVGQYQHDLNQSRLARSLDASVEDCVNLVGVDLNMASAPLLARVSGLNINMAENIVAHRNLHGPFKERKQLLDVSRLGPKAFEQAAGFLRIRQGTNPLDESAVHPEAYPLVENILRAQQCRIKDLIGNKILIKNIRAENFVNEQFGLPTITDVLSELEKPGRDPRPEFKTASFKEGVEKLSDLKVDMILEGVISNVTPFGAFVDIGVHQDGLVHISELSHNFIKDPREVVRAGDIVKVRVVECDSERKRIALSMRLDSKKTDKAPENIKAEKNNRASNTNKKIKNEISSNPFAQAFAKAKEKNK
jgi:protein Tex